MTFDLVLSKTGVKQNYTAQEVNRHAPLIAYSISFSLTFSPPPTPPLGNNSDFRHLPIWVCIIILSINMFLKGYPLEAKTAPKNWN